MEILDSGQISNLTDDEKNELLATILKGLSEQEINLTERGETLSEQEKRIAEQDEKLSEQERRFAEQDEKLSEQKDQLRQEAAAAYGRAQEKYESVERLAESAKLFSTIGSAITMLGGLVVGLVAATLFSGGEWSDWQQIKNSHRYTNTKSGAVLYDHQKLHESEIQALRVALGLPIDFSAFVTESDLPPEVNLDGFLRTGDTIVLETYGNKGFSIEANTADFRDKQLFTAQTNPNSVHQVFFVRKVPPR